MSSFSNIQNPLYFSYDFINLKNYSIWEREKKKKKEYFQHF